MADPSLRREYNPVDSHYAKGAEIPARNGTCMEQECNEEGMETLKSL
jgi:hypothetical protein